MGLFSDASNGRIQSITKERIQKYNLSMFKLEEMLKDINIKNKYGLPLVPESEEYLSDNQFKHTYRLDETYKSITDYFIERKLPNFDLLLNEYEDSDNWVSVKYEQFDKIRSKTKVESVVV